MLNLPIAMLKLFLILALFFQDAAVSITSPQSGQTLRGQIEIQGRMDVQDFASAELAFTFDASASDPAASWFPIQTYSQPAADSAIAIWDTTAVTDGDYALRLRVFLQDGTFQDALATGLKAQNEAPPPTATFTEAVFNFKPLNETPGAPESVQPTSTSPITYATSTPLPANPASLTTTAIFTIFWQSALIILVLFAFFSLVLRLRKNR